MISPVFSKNSRILFSPVEVYPCGFFLDHMILGINNISKKSNPIYENPQFPNILFSSGQNFLFCVLYYHPEMYYTVFRFRFQPVF